MVENKTYFITMDHGLALGLQSCGIESLAIREKKQWNFTISKLIFLFMKLVTSKIKLKAGCL